jgi:pimeloyl-ACP methyl ester carboxylesterase
VVGMAHRVGVDAFQRPQRAIMTHSDRRAHLRAIACPTLLLHGRQAQLMPPNLSEEMVEAIPGAHLALLEDCGHLPMLEQPTVVTELLRAWLVACEGNRNASP